MFQDRDVEALTGLGLTALQARIYLAIASLEKATIKAISENADTARQEIYRATSELQQKGLVEKIIVAPVEYRAIPLQDAINVLLQRAHQKNLATHEKAMELLRRANEKSITAERHEEHQLILIPKKEASRRRFGNALRGTAVSVDGIFYGKGYRDVITNAVELWKKSLEKGVKVRLIVYEPQEEKAVARILQTLKKKGSFSIRYTLHPPPATLAIFDGEKTLITISPTPDPLETSGLWVKNSSLAIMAQDYFDLLWRASEDGQEKTKMKI